MPTGFLGYAWGQCTYFVAKVWRDTGLGDALGGLPDAKDWLSSAAQRGQPVSKTPSLGSVVVYNGNFPGSHGYGHVGIVTRVGGPNGSFEVASDNWGAPGVTHIGASTMQYVEGFISPPSAIAGANAAKQALLEAGGTQNVQLDAPWNWPGDIAGGVTGAVSGSLADALNGARTDILRGFLILFGGALVIVGIIVLFKDVAPAAQNSGTPDTVAEGPTTTKTVETRGPRGGKKGSVITTTTSSHRVAGKKSSGVRGKLRKGAEKAGEAEAGAAVVAA